jgi:hypothetical protein
MNCVEVSHRKRNEGTTYEAWDHGKSFEDSPQEFHSRNFGFQVSWHSVPARTKNGTCHAIPFNRRKI